MEKKEETLFPLFQCFEQMDDLATKGLDPHRDDQCATMAKATFSGTLDWEVIDHMRWNLQHYVEGYDILLNPSKEVFVLRTTDLLPDWQTVNAILGDSSTVSIPPAVSHRRQEDEDIINNNDAGNQQKSASVMRLPPIHSRYISPEGMSNICCALKGEIALYEHLLRRAVNIEQDAYHDSMQKLQSKCQFRTLEDLAATCAKKFKNS